MNLMLLFLSIVSVLVSCPCLDAISFPTVKFILVGYNEILNSNPSVVKAAGSVTLVQSNGKNVLVDTGTTNLAAFVKDVLGNSSQLLPKNIDLTFITHTHPDHYSNVLLFSNEQSEWTYSVKGDIFSANPLQYGNNYFLFNDTNLEVWLTPGHTPDDCSLLVHNCNNSAKTVGIVGDLFFNASDTDNPSLWQSASNDIETQSANRKKVACAVDYIIPGHGAIFEITKDMKANVFLCNSAVNLCVGCSIFVFILFVTNFFII